LARLNIAAIGYKADEGYKAKRAKSKFWIGNKIHVNWQAMFLTPCWWWTREAAA
jgi:hypothetical protein